ncbi:hypothetical protein V6N13_085271 [Hibiscus sabdariffa]|uniref:Uncharacterized protein n=1 Tax=Hibiscus sabdariffa TaxID=183260 RepID=A0ABR2D1Y4_9ROSI
MATEVVEIIMSRINDVKNKARENIIEVIDVRVALHDLRLSLAYRGVVERTGDEAVTNGATTDGTTA